jgi:hypothetical protein
MKKSILVLFFLIPFLKCFCQPPKKPILVDKQNLQAAKSPSMAKTQQSAVTTISIDNDVFNQVSPYDYQCVKHMPYFQQIAKVGNYWIYITEPFQGGQTTMTFRTSATNYPNKPPCGATWEKSSFTYGPFVPSGNFNTINITGNCQ